MNAKKVRSKYLELRAKFIQYEGVLGVGLGGAEKGGKLTGELAVIVLVEKKLPKNRVSKGEYVTTSYQGVRIDVREARLTHAQHMAFVKLNGLTGHAVEENMDLFWVDHVKLHHMYQRRRKAEGRKQTAKVSKFEPGDEPKDAPTTSIHGEIFVIEDADNDSVINADGTIDHVAAYNLFRTEFGDHYDFAVFRPDTTSGLPGGGNSSPTIYNQISGINHYMGDSYDGRTGWGTSKLQSIQKMGFLGQVRTCLHETSHRWCSYVYHQEGGVHNENLHEYVGNPSQRPFHWGTWFDNDNSCMDYDHEDWIDSTTVPGEFEKVALVSGVPGVDQFGFHPLDLYLMGLIDPTEVGGFRYIDTPSDPDGDNSYSGAQVDLTITNVTDEEGARNPAYPNTQRVYHQAFLLITRDMSQIGTLTDSTTPLGELELYRKGLIDAFRRETRSRGMIDGSLLHENFEQVYIRDNSADSGTASSTGAFWDSPDIWVRNANDGGTAHQDTIRGQDNYIGIRVCNDSGEDYADVTVRVYRANWAGTEFYYPEDWHPDNLIGEETLDVPASSSATLFLRWDMTMIPDATWHPCLLVELIPMEVTPEGRSHVWENRKLAQKNITIINPPGDEDESEFGFHFGHATRKFEKEPAILTIARIFDIEGMALFLDPDGIEIQQIQNVERLPARQYLASEGYVKPAGNLAGFSPARRMCQGGLTVTFPQDTQIIIGTGGDCDNEPGCLGMTICRGSRFRLHAASKVDHDSNNLVRLFRDGRLLYRLPSRELVGVQVQLTNRGVVPMKLIVDLSQVPKTARSGKVSLIQSTADGAVVGGVDLIVRP